MQQGITQFMQVVGRGYLAFRESSKLCYAMRQCRERAKNAYWVFKNDEMAWDRHGCSYQEYVSHIIDACVAQQEVAVINGSDVECK